MATAPAVGNGPIDFVGSDGEQLTIPLSAIKFVDGNVTSEVTADGLDTWLKYLVAQGQLAPGPTAAAEAMVFKAVTDGATGNDITVTVKAAGASAVEITVNEKHVYKGLNFKSAADSERSLEKVLDSSSGALVHVANFTGGTGTPAKGTVVAAGSPGTPPWSIKDTDGNDLATLNPRSAAWNTGVLTVDLGDVDDKADPITFTLTMAWASKPVIVQETDVTGGALAPNDLKFSVTIDPATSLPKPGTFTLQGGADAVSKPAEAASATLPANE